MGMGVVAAIIILSLVITLLPNRSEETPNDDRARERELKWNKDFHGPDRDHV
jgi:hypothetical protein